MEKLSLRERKKIKVRNTIIETATRLFLENGFDNTTIDTIADEAEVSPSTIFRYFPTKEAMVFYNHSKRVERFKYLIDSHNKTDETPIDCLTNAFREFAVDYKDWQRELLAEWKIVSKSPFLLGHDVALDFEYEEAIEAYMLDVYKLRISEFEAKVIAGAIFGAVRSTMREWLQGNCNEDLLEVGAKLLSMVIAILTLEENNSITS